MQCKHTPYHFSAENAHRAAKSSAQARTTSRKTCKQCLRQIPTRQKNKKKRKQKTLYWNNEKNDITTLIAAKKFRKITEVSYPIPKPATE